MKFLFTGGGSGGHFYPLIAVAEETARIAKEKNLLEPKLYYIAEKPYDEKMLYENSIEFHHATAGKLALGANPFVKLINAIRTGLGVLKAIPLVYRIYPDVVFSKGGYESVPTIAAAHILRIPIMIHDSDAIPGRANLWAAKYADRIAVSYPSAARFFPNPEVVAHTGNPVRHALLKVARHGAHEFLNLSPEVPTIFIIGGSQGAQVLNEAIMEALPTLVGQFQIIHQTGAANFDDINKLAQVVLDGNPHQLRYRPFAYLNDLAMKMAAGAADVIVSRAGSGAIFEIAEWEKPAILIPIPEDVSRDQRENAFSYARAGGAVVIEQNNLTPHVLEAEIQRIVQSKEVAEQMATGARTFKRPEAARIIADELFALALTHEE
jgi:UDP-N-acetylglucosamine--N-acetylmuramyl-(pentapeptide) pyrophosphoryl-undecaprenol N-acetylglucosamine transferase